MAKILVVDDALNARTLLALALSQSKHQVVQAVNGKEALAEIERGRPDLIFMDLRMPVLNGESTAQILKEDPATAAIPIVAVSAKTIDRDALPHFDYCLAKPYQISEIIDLVAQFCEQTIAAPQ